MDNNTLHMYKLIPLKILIRKKINNFKDFILHNVQKKNEVIETSAFNHAYIRKNKFNKRNFHI